MDFKDMTCEDLGFMGLYGGECQKDIRARKGVYPGFSIREFMGFTELAANLFRTTQTEEKIQRDEISDENEMKRVYFEVGEMVRHLIKELGGTMPEDMPLPNYDQ